MGRIQVDSSARCTPSGHKFCWVSGNSSWTALEGPVFKKLGCTTCCWRAVMKRPAMRCGHGDTSVQLASISRHPYCKVRQDSYHLSRTLDVRKGCPHHAKLRLRHVLLLMGRHGESSLRGIRPPPLAWPAGYPHTPHGVTWHFGTPPAAMALQ